MKMLFLKRASEPQKRSYFILAFDRKVRQSRSTKTAIFEQNDAILVDFVDRLWHHWRSKSVGGLPKFRESARQRSADSRNFRSQPTYLFGRHKNHFNGFSTAFQWLFTSFQRLFNGFWRFFNGSWKLLTAFQRLFRLFNDFSRRFTAFHRFLRLVTACHRVLSPFTAIKCYHYLTIFSLFRCLWQNLL